MIKMNLGWYPYEVKLKEIRTNLDRTYIYIYIKSSWEEGGEGTFVPCFS